MVSDYVRDGPAYPGSCSRMHSLYAVPVAARAFRAFAVWIYRKEGKISVDMMGEAVVNALSLVFAGVDEHPERTRLTCGWGAGTTGHPAKRCRLRLGRRQIVPLLP